MKDRHAFDHGVCEIHNYIYRAANRHVHGVQPEEVIYWAAICAVSQKMNLMNMHGVNFACMVDNLPVLISADTHGGHRTCGGFVFPAVDVESILILREGSYEIWLRVLIPA